MLIMKIYDIMTKPKNDAPNFSYVAKYRKMYQKIIKKDEKMLREESVIFALDPKLDAPNFLYVTKYMKMYQKIIKK